MRNLAFLALMLSALTGCQAYSWRTRVPAEYRAVAVPTFRNETTVPTVGSMLTRQVRRELQREGSFRLEESEASVEVQGTVTAVNNRGESSRRTYYSRLITGSVLLTAKISVVDRVRGKVVIDNRNYQVESPYADSTDMVAARDLAIERAADDLARMIVDDLTLFNWKEESK